MKPLTNETLIEEIEKVRIEILQMIYRATERGQFNPSYFNEPFRKWYLKALQAKEVVVRKETLEEIRDILTSEGGGVDALYKFLGYELSSSKDKLSNLSEK